MRENPKLESQTNLFLFIIPFQIVITFSISVSINETDL